MKRLTSLFAGLFFLIASFSANAQAKTGVDYFTGKWSVLVKGTPNGDAKMIFLLERKGADLIGVVQDTTGKEIAKLDKVELAEKTATLYFNASGYDVSLELNKKDEDHVTGSLLGMFDAEGDRLKSTK